MALRTFIVLFFMKVIFVTLSETLIMKLLSIRLNSMTMTLIDNLLCFGVSTLVASCQFNETVHSLILMIKFNDTLYFTLPFLIIFCSGLYGLVLLFRRSRVRQTKSKQMCVYSLNMKMPDENNYINVLPDSILLSIFSFLTLETRLLKVSLVCTSWHTLSRDQYLWHECEILYNISDAFIVRNVRTSWCVGIFLRLIEVTDYKLLTDDELLNLLDSSPLSEIKITG